jgi:hypothetical protein
MPITLHPELETRLRKGADAEGLTLEAYLERLVRIDQQAREELESLALEGLDSGPTIEAGPGYWEAKHRQLDERLKNSR